MANSRQTFRRASNNSRVLQVFQRTIPHGKSLLVLTAIRDNTKLISLQKHKQEATLKTAAFGQAAHEFKNPLNGIISSLEILKTMVYLDERSLQIFNVALSCTNLMLFLIKDIQDLS